MKIIKYLSIVFSALLFLIFIGTQKTVYAIEDPLVSPNNKFGIHLFDENDLDDAAKLVNSNGGDWGYVTIVIRKDERNIDKWQQTFDKMRRLHLIPIVRIASAQQDGGWEKLQKDDIDSWVYFLNSLNWVVKNRYVVIGNEPNHATEWSDEVNPEEYADYLVEVSSKLKSASDDFFVLPAGFDASAPDNKTHISEQKFLKLMKERVPGIFDHVDGWTSHSYPNPDFSGSEEDIGKGSVRTFEWELNLLKSMDVNKKLPVFITETGWAHDTDDGILSYKDDVSVAKNFINAYKDAWNNSNIVAITPFILNYQGEPFNIFSWKKKDGSFYNFYYEIQKLNKLKGEPKRINSGDIVAVLMPQVIKRGDKVYGMAYVKNTGQVIWKSGEISLIDENDRKLVVEPPYFYDIEPRDSGFMFFSATVDKSENNTSKIEGSLKLTSNKKDLGESYNYEILQYKASTPSADDAVSNDDDNNTLNQLLSFNFIKRISTIRLVSEILASI